MKKIKLDINDSEDEFPEIFGNFIAGIASSAEKKIKELEDELGKLVAPEKYEEFVKMLDEFQSATSEKAAESLKTAFEEKFFKYSEKYPDASEMEFLKSILPKTFYISNNQLANEIIKDFVDKGNKNLVVMKTQKKGEVSTYNSLTYEGKNIIISGSHEFTAYDRAIHNAVCSLYVSGNEVVTPSMVYRTMNGMSETEYVSPQSIEAVTNSLDKSRSLKLKVDFTDEARARGLNVDATTIESNLLVADKLRVKSGANILEAYKIFRVPVLYQYAQYTRQILSVPLKLLDTKKATRNTEEIIPIKEYLIRRIEIMKYDRAMSNKIIYETIFEEVGIEIKTKQQKERLRNYISSILELWKTRDKYINDFKEFKQGNSIKGIEIFY